MPLGTPYHSFALPYPIRVDNFTDTLDNLPPPYNRPRLHLLTHTHSDHIVGLASKSFAYRVICSRDAKEMLLRHEAYAERSLHDHEYRAEKKKTFGHLKIDPCVMPNGQRFFTGSRDLLHAIPLNTPTPFDISDSETVTITLIDANHCPGSVMFLIEGSCGTVLHTGDLRAEPWFLSSIQRNPFLEPYLASSSENLQIFVARKEGTHAEAVGLVKTLEAIYLDTACLLSPLVVPAKETAAQGIVGLMAEFPSTTHFFINTWTWGYEDVLKAVGRAFQCKIHFDRYKYSIYSRGSDPLLRALGTDDAASTRFHACERFDRCSFVDVPVYNYGAKGAVAPPSKEGKKVVYVNAVNMSCARWEDYQAEIKRRISRGENIDSLLVPLSRHSPLPELMNFVTLFRPLRVVPNTLDPSLNGLDWGAMSKMFSGCLSPASEPGSLVSVMAPPCPLTCDPSVASLPGPYTECDRRIVSAIGKEYMDTAYSNLIGPSDAAEKWGDRGEMQEKIEVLKSWLGAGRRKCLGSSRQRVDEDEGEALGNEMDELGLVAEPSRLSSSGINFRTPKKYAKNDDSGESSDEGGSDDHARTAWNLFGVGKLADVCKTWASPSSQTQAQVRAKAVDIGTLPTPTSSPFLHERRLAMSNKGKERAIEHPSQSDLPLATPVKPSLGRALTEIVLSPIAHDASRLTSFLSACTSPFVSFKDIRFSGQLPEEQANETAGSGSQPFSRLENVVHPDLSQEPISPSHLTLHQSQSQQALREHRRDPSITQDVGNVGAKRDVENVGQVSLSKRRRIDRDGSILNTGEKDGVLELPGRKLSRSESVFSTPRCNGSCESPQKSITRLTRMATIPAVARGDNKEALRAPTVTSTPTISFPVKKHIDDRALRVGKTSSLSALPSSRISTRQEIGSGLASSSTSAIAHEGAIRTNGIPVSPRTAARRAERAERKRITEKLRLARPDLVRAQPSRGGSKSRLSERGAASLADASTSTTVLTSMDIWKGEASNGNALNVMAEDVEMDWERSRQLAESVKEAVQRGQHINEVLPRLRCLEQWYANRA